MPNTEDPYEAVYNSPMKKLIALAAVTFASQAVVAFAGEPVVSSKQVITPAPPPPEFFRPNEWDIGAFGTYVSGTGDNPTGTRVRDGFSTTYPVTPLLAVGAEAWISLIFSLGNMQV